MMGSQLFSGWCQMFLDVFRCSQDALNWLQIFWWHSQMCSRVLENDPVGSKILKRNVCVSDSEIKVEKEQPDHEVLKMCSDVQMKLRIECFKCWIRPHWRKSGKNKYRKSSSWIAFSTIVKPLNQCYIFAAQNFLGPICCQSDFWGQIHKKNSGAKFARAQFAGAQFVGTQYARSNLPQKMPGAWFAKNPLNSPSIRLSVSPQKKFPLLFLLLLCRLWTILSAQSSSSPPNLYHSGLWFLLQVSFLLGLTEKSGFRVWFG